MQPRTRIKLLFLLPAAAWVLVWTIFPFFYGLWLSLFHIDFGGEDRFIGMGNFERFFSDRNALNAVKITFLFVLGSVTVQVILGLLLALAANRPLPLRGLVRTMLILPLFATPVAVGFLFFTIFYEEGGLVNGLLRIKVPWLSSPGYALIAIIVADTWQWISFCFLILLAGLQSIPDDVYEAAALETRNRWKIFWHITFPYLQPTLVLVILLRITEAFKVFAIPYTLTRGGPGNATLVLPMYAYRAGMRFFDFGYASAISFMAFVLVMLFIIFLFRSIRQAY
jgi:multiple sugar transport system permease protein